MRVVLRYFMILYVYTDMHYTHLHMHMHNMNMFIVVPSLCIGKLVHTFGHYSYMVQPMQQPGTNSDQYETRRIEVAWRRPPMGFLAVPIKYVSFIGDFPIEAPISRGFPIATFDYQRVLVLSPFLISIHCMLYS